MSVSSTSSKVTIGATSSTLLAEKKNRRKIHIINNSDSDIALAFGGEVAVLTEGTILKAGGGAYFDSSSAENEGIGIFDQVTAIGDGASKIVSYTEWLTN
jgi:hypothetical protein